MTSVTSEFEIPVELHLSDGIRERVQAHISRVNTGFIVLRSPIPIEPGRILDVLYLERQIRCETAYCQRPSGGGYRIGARMLDGGGGALRAERRIKLDAAGQLNTSALPKPIPARVIDISSSGLGVKLEHPLTVGDLAYAELEHGVAFGEIRHCEEIAGGYRAGLFIEEFISRTPGARSPWAACGLGRSTSFSVARALRTALSGHKKC